MNKGERKGQVALSLLISGIVFLTNTVAMLLTFAVTYALARLGVIQVTRGLSGVLKFIFCISHIMI